MDTAQEGEPIMRFFVRLAAVTAVIGLFGTSSAQALPQSADQQFCIAKVGKAASKVLKAQGIETRGCLRRAFAGSLPLDDGQTCQRADLRSRVATARGKLATLAAAVCTPRPTLAFHDVATFSDAPIDQEVALSQELFGESLALGAVRVGLNPGGAKCQEALLSAADRAMADQLKSFGKCLGVGLRSGALTEPAHLQDCVFQVANQTAGMADELRARIVASCPGQAWATVFPGRCAASDGAFELADCLTSAVECRSCRLFTSMHDFDFDCDAFDDGTSNGSCSEGAVVTTTTTTTTTLPPTPTVCGNAADAAIAQDFDLFAEATTCTYGCLSAPSLPQCVATCVRNATGLSGDCALCYGVSAQCGLVNCAGSCAVDQGSPACTACLDTNCIPAFDTCAAEPAVTTTTVDTTTTTLDTTTTTTTAGPTTTTTIPLAGYCTGPADQAVLDAVDEDAATRTCTFPCLSAGDIAQCIGDCVATATGLSGQCALCYGDSAECGVFNCAGACAINPSGASCLACVQANCAAAQNACIGVPPTTTTTLDTTTTTTTTTTLDTTTTTLAPVTGACTNPADEAVDVLFDMQAQATTCTVGCLSSPTRVACVAACVEAATGASAECSGCYADTAECGLQNCAGVCAIDQGAPPCQACLDQYCVESFDECTGFGDPPLPASCSNGIADGTETDIDCGGSCAKCVIGDSCAAAGDCVSGECVSEVCSAPTRAIPFGSCVNGYIDPFTDPEALDLGAFGSGADDGYRFTLASTTDVYLQLTNQAGSTAVVEASMLSVAGDAASAIAGLGTGEVVEGQNGTAGPTSLGAGTYYLYVDSAAADTFGPYDICVLPAPTIALGSCVSASVGNGDGDDVQLAGAGGDKGFRFTSPSSTNVIVKLRNLSGASTMAAGIYNGAGLVASSSTGTTPLFTERRTGLVAVAAGTPYTVQVDTAAADSFGTFEVCVVEAGCGDGIVSGGEACDDGNQVAGDGCNGSCALESGKIVVNSCRSGNIPLFPVGEDCDDWTLPILETEGVYLEVTSVAGTLLGKGSLRQGGTQLVATNNVSIGQSGSTSPANLTAGGTYTARFCDVTGAGTGNYTICVREARKVELGTCYAGNVADGDGNAIDLAGPISGGDEAVLLQPPTTTTARLTLTHKGGGGLLAAGVYTGEPGSLLAGSAVGASPSPIASGQSGQSGLFEINGAQVYRVYTDIASLGTAGTNYEICLAEVAGDACLNPEDELVRSSVNLDEEAGSSGLSCTGGAACISEHMQGVGLSAGCADCYGGTGSCAASNCAFQCLSDSGSSGCRSCVASNCAQEFEVCSGWAYQD